MMATKFKSKNKILCFYNSEFDKIITDQELMTIPLYDKMANRGNSVMDGINVRQRKFINIKNHLSRL